MPAIGIALLWAAYSAGLWGYCLMRGYNVTPKQLLSTTWPPKSVNAQGFAQDALGAVANTKDQQAGQAVGGFLNNLPGTGPNKAQ